MAAPGVPDHVPDHAVLVIGAGFIGAAVACRLAELNRPVTVVTRRALPLGSPLVRGPARVVVAGCDRNVLGDLVGSHGHVVLAAGRGSPATAHGRVNQAINSELDLLEVVLAAGRPGLGFTYLSSGGAVYGNAAQLPTSESAPTRAISEYGQAKLAGEQLIRRSVRADQRARILRIGNVYGPGQPDSGVQGVVGSAFRAALTGEPMAIIDGGRAIRDFVHVNDVVTAILTTIDPPQRLVVVNVGTGAGTAISEVVRATEILTGRAIQTYHVDARPFDVRASVLDIGALRALIGFEPISMAAGLAACWAWLTASGHLVPEPVQV